MGVKDDATADVKVGPDKTSALASYWAETFQKSCPTANLTAARRYAEKFATKLNFEKFQCP